MRLLIPILFLTLVVSGLAAKASPYVELEPQAIEMSPKDKSDLIYESETPHHNTSLRIGIIIGALSEANSSDQIYFCGLRYDFLKDSYQTWLAEAAMAPNNYIHLVIGKKYYSLVGDSLRSYYKFSIGDFINSTDGLGAIFNLKNIQAMAAVGVDDVFQWDQRLQLEIGASYALMGPQIEASFGFAF